MSVQIPEESNDQLLVNLLGISSISVFFDDMEFGGGVIKPTDASIQLSEEKYATVEPTSDQQFAARQWTAGKLGIDISKVEIA